MRSLCVEPSPPPSRGGRGGRDRRRPASASRPRLLVGLGLAAVAGPLGPESVRRRLDRVPVEAAPLQVLADPLAELALVGDGQALYVLLGGAVGVVGLVALAAQRLVDHLAPDALLEELGPQRACALGAVEQAVLEPVLGEGPIVDQLPVGQPHQHALDPLGLVPLLAQPRSYLALGARPVGQEAERRLETLAVALRLGERGAPGRGFLARPGALGPPLPGCQLGGEGAEQLLHATPRPRPRRPCRRTAWRWRGSGARSPRAPRCWSAGTRGRSRGPGRPGCRRS